MICDKESQTAYRSALKDELAKLTLRLVHHEQNSAPIENLDLERGRYIQSYLSANDGNVNRLSGFLDDSYTPTAGEVDAVIAGIRDNAMHAVICGEFPQKALQMARDPQLLKKATNISLGAISEGMTAAFNSLVDDKIVPAKVETLLGVGNVMRQQYPYVKGHLGETWIDAALGAVMEKVEQVSSSMAMWLPNARKARCEDLVSRMKKAADSFSPLEQRPL